MVQITGILTDPLGNPMAGAVIRITPQDNGDTLQCLSGSVTTGADGSYDFTLKEDLLFIEVCFNRKKWTRTGKVNTTGATGPIDLETLFELYEVADV